MRIYDMKANHLTNPVGFRLDPLRLSWKADGTRAKSQKAACVRIALDRGFQQIVYDSGEQAGLDSLCHVPGIALLPRTRYWWEVTVFADNGDSARGTAFFETGKMGEPWKAGWITAPEIEGNINLYHEFSMKKLPARARAYVTGLGLYELYINGIKVTDEVLTPYYNAYDRWVQVQAWDLDALLRVGQNQVKVMLGDGWFKGRFGFDNASRLYGDTQALLMEIVLTEEGGQETFITTGPDWQAGPSRVRFANIYDGETFDATLDESPRAAAVPCKGPDTRQLSDRLSPPLRVVQTLKPLQILQTPAGETVVDLGQEITGYLAFFTRAPRGTRMKLSYFEILQDGNFFRDNLRSARQEQVYIADGTEVTVRPHFTFFGFRYVKLEGFAAPKPEDFEGCVIHSDLEHTLVFDSANPKVNRLQENAFWGQRCNFLDVPTDCPQRDERMGWTGDAQAFSGTACFQMHCGAFFNKYLFDMREEQQKLDGSIPYTVPENFRGHGSCAWADAAAIIPWNLYLFYGDRAMLETHYPLMRGWVEWVYRQDEQDGGKRLWETGFHYADWLALDTRDGSAHGGTDPWFIASAYYYYSTSLLLKAAQALNKTEDIQRYAKLQAEIFDAFQRQYFTPGGRLAQTTQTGYVCALFMELAEPEQRAGLARLLARELEASKGALRTGFVGTPYLCRVLTREGYNGLAYELLLREEFPGWLYAVNLGATTIWERWNSVLRDGRLSDIHMNSLNHYTYGSIMEWVYRHAAGLNPVEGSPGFRSVLLKPHPDPRLPRLDVRYESAAGLYRSAWEIKYNRFTWNVSIPFHCTAKTVFPFAQAAELKNHLPELKIKEDGDGAFALLTAGEYRFEYPVSNTETL